MDDYSMMVDLCLAGESPPPRPPAAVAARPAEASTAAEASTKPDAEAKPEATDAAVAAPPEQVEKVKVEEKDPPEEKTPAVAAQEDALCMPQGPAQAKTEEQEVQNEENSEIPDFGTGDKGEESKDSDDSDDASTRSQSPPKGSAPKLEPRRVVSPARSNSANAPKNRNTFQSTVRQQKVFIRSALEPRRFNQQAAVAAMRRQGAAVPATLPPHRLPLQKKAATPHSATRRTVPRARAVKAAVAALRSDPQSTC